MKVFRVFLYLKWKETFGRFSGDGFKEFFGTLLASIAMVALLLAILLGFAGLLFVYARILGYRLTYSESYAALFPIIVFSVVACTPICALTIWIRNNWNMAKLVVSRPECRDCSSLYWCYKEDYICTRITDREEERS